MIMRTENAVAVVNTALSPAIKPPKGRRVMVGPAIGPASNTLMGLQSVSRNGEGGIQTGGKDKRRCPTSPADPSIVTALECAGLHAKTRTRRTNSRKPGRDRGSETSARGPKIMADIRREQAT